MVYRRRPNNADFDDGSISRAVPDETTPELLFAAIEKIISQNRYAGWELSPFQWCQQWNEISPDVARGYRPERGRYVKQRVPDKAVYSFWYEVTVDEINAQWFAGNTRLLVRSKNPFEMAVEMAAAWNGTWPTSTIISEVGADKTPEVEALYAAKGLQINVVTDAVPHCRHGYVNLATPQISNRVSAPPGTLFLQHEIGKAWPGIEANHCKSAGFTAQHKDLGLSRDVAESYAFIIDTNAHLFGPSTVPAPERAEPIGVDVSPGMSRLLEDRYHNWQLAEHRSFKALTLDEQTESVRQDTRQELFDQALRFYGTPLEDEVLALLASLEQEATKAGEQWRQHVVAFKQAQADLAAVLP